MRLKTIILLLLAIFLAALLCLEKIFGIPTIISSIFGKKEEITALKTFSFSGEDSLKEWDEKILHKKVTYKIDSSNGESYVHAISNRSCSAMYYNIKLDLRRNLMLSWKWRVDKFPEKKSPDDLLSKEEDDFPARVYVIFSALFFSSSKVLEYIWSRDLEIGTISSSPYSTNIKLIVAESGPKVEGKWVSEERNIYEDYLLAFNEKPRLKIGAIAFMCDSDSTDSSAEAYFDEIKFSIKDK